MNIEAEKTKAQELYEISKNFIEFSPAARNFLAHLSQKEKNFSPNHKKTLILQMEELILISDHFIRMRILEAMQNLCHVSKNIGLIASFYNPERKTKEERELSERTRSYLYEVLSLRELDFFEILAVKLRHWEGCLSIDYSEEFRTMRERVKINGKLTIKERQLSDEELAVELAASKSRTLILAQQDLREYGEKYFGTDFVQRRAKAVYDGLDNIFYHLFSQEKNKENVANVLQLLSQFATWKHFPQSWLMTLAQKNANQ